MEAAENEFPKACLLPGIEIDWVSALLDFVFQLRLTQKHLLMFILFISPEELATVHE